MVVTDDLIGRGVKAGELIKELAEIAGGTGGGRPHLAQAGTKDPGRLSAAVEAAPEVIAARLS